MERALRKVFSMKLAGMLMQQGFVLVKLEPNENNPSKNVFVFYDSPEIERRINLFSKRK